MNRTTLGAVVLLAGAALLSGCAVTGTASPAAPTSPAATGASAQPTSGSAKPSATKKATSPTKANTPPPAGTSVCHGATFSAYMADAGMDADKYMIAILVTNNGPATCTLQGASRIIMLAGGDGRPMQDIHEVTDSTNPGLQLTLQPGGKAQTFASYVPGTPGNPGPGCEETVVGMIDVTLPGDEGQPKQGIVADPVDPTFNPPLVCSAVEVMPWFAPEN